MKLNDAVDFARTNRWSVLTTIRGNGRTGMPTAPPWWPTGGPSSASLPERAYGMLGR